MPQWITPALAFNNTTSLPLLLVQSLDASGILASIDSSSGVVDRAKSYFLVNAMISNSLTFAIGPRFLDCSEDVDASEPKAGDGDDREDEDAALESQEQEAERANEESSLLPQRVADSYTRVGYSAYTRGRRFYTSLPPWAQGLLSFVGQFVNPPVIGGGGARDLIAREKGNTEP
jgi:auxin efflux carrier family protein